jgi:hypothetical protein
MIAVGLACVVPALSSLLYLAVEVARQLLVDVCFPTLIDVRWLVAC